jgi:hypothetical protein
MHSLTDNNVPPSFAGEAMAGKASPAASCLPRGAMMTRDGRRPAVAASRAGVAILQYASSMGGGDE